MIRYIYYHFQSIDLLEGYSICRLSIKKQEDVNIGDDVIDELE